MGAGAYPFQLAASGRENLAKGADLRQFKLEKEMKTFIATSFVSLCLAVPAAAETAQEFFALSNDSAAERIVSETSVGDPIEAAKTLAMTNDSPAELNLNFERARGVDVAEVQAMFALSNDSAAERVVK